MADLFSFQPGQAVVNPTSAQVRVDPDRRAANAAKSLSNLLQSGAELHRNKLIAQEKANKEAQDASDIEQAFGISQEQTALFSQYQHDLSRAGKDIVRRDALTAQHSEAQRLLFENVNPEVRGKVSALGNKLVRDTESSNSRQRHALVSSEFLNNVSTFSPSLSAMSPEEMKKAHGDILGEAQVLGIPLNVVGDTIATSMFNYQVGSLDIESMVNNSDYSQINQIFASLEQLREIDPKASAKILELSESLHKTKNLIDSNVKQTITLAREAGQYGAFSHYVDLAVENKVMSEMAAKLEYSKYHAKFLEKGNIVKDQATNFINNNNGRVILSQHTGTPLGKELESQVKDILRSQFNAQDLSTVDSELVRHYANTSPGLIKDMVSSRVDTEAGLVRLLLDIKPKTEQEEMQVQAGLAQAMQNLDRVKHLSSNNMSSEDLVKIATLQAVMIPGVSDNPAETLRLISSQGGVKTLPSGEKYIDKLSKNVPWDQMVQAKNTYSSLAAAGIDKDKAYDAVASSFSSSKAGKSDTMYSKAALETLSVLGISSDSMKNFESSLLNRGENALFEDEEIDTIEKILSGENPTVSMLDGNLVFGNDTERFPLRLTYPVTTVDENGDDVTTTLGAVIAKRVSEDYVNANQPTVWGKMATSVADNISEYVSDKAASFSHIGKAGGHLIDAFSVNRFKKLGELYQEEATVLNKVLDDLVFGELPLSEASERFFKASISFSRKQLQLRGEASKEALEHFDKAIKSLDLGRSFRIIGNIDDFSGQLLLIKLAFSASEEIAKQKIENRLKTAEKASKTIEEERKLNEKWPSE